MACHSLRCIMPTFKACHECTHEYTQTQIHGFMVLKSHTQIIGYWFPMSIFDKYSQVFCYFSGKIHSKLILRSSMILNLE